MRVCLQSDNGFSMKASVEKMLYGANLHSKIFFLKETVERLWKQTLVIQQVILV